MTTTALSGRRARVALRRGTASAAERRWLLWPPVLFFLVALGLPVVQLIATSLDGGGTAWGEALTNHTFLAALERTLLLALIVTVITVLMGAVYALGIWAAPRWLAGIFVALLFISLWTSLMVRSVAWMLLEIPKGAIYWFLNLLGLVHEPITLYQTTIGMYPAMVAVMLPYVVLPVMTGLGGIDREQINAAVVFGARPGLVFRSVIWPQLVPQMFSTGVLVFVMSLGFYVTPLLLGGPSNLAVSGVIDLELNKLNEPDVGSVMSLLLVATTIVVYLTADRVFRVSERWG